MQENKDDLYPGLAHKTLRQTQRTYTNPERGFYTGRDFRTAQDDILTKTYIWQNRVKGISIIYTGYYLTDFMESDIAPEYLEMIDANMQVLRENGAKCLLRFAYKTDMYETGHPWDAKPEWVHRHIDQLKPVLQRNSDVIFCLQAGFIGVWGEWAYSDNFVYAPKTPEDHVLRKEVVKALLDAMPKSRQIALRTPMFKRNMFLDSYADTLTIETAYNGSDVSRICAHNDCFGASADDYGTFTIVQTRNLWKADTRYVLMGGETCNLSEYCRCEKSLRDMKEYHWTYLSGPSNISDRWKKDGCHDEIVRRLGYRLSVTNVYYTPKAEAGKDFRLILEIQNSGFAAPMNPRCVELIIMDTNRDKTTYKLEDVDPRYWFAGEKVVLDKKITLPENMTGDCTLYLNLPDPEPHLHDNPFFSIRLANADTWEEETGYNKILELEL